SQARQWEALFELSRDVTATTNVNELFSFVVHRATDLLDADVAVLKLLSRSRQTLVVVAGAGLRAAELSGIRPLVEYPLLRQTIENRQASTVEDYPVERTAGGARWALMEEEDLISAIVVPVLGREEALGVI